MNFYVPQGTPSESTANARGYANHLLGNTSSQEFGFAVVSVKQTTAMRYAPKGRHQLTLHLFPITAPIHATSLEIFRLTKFCHIIIEVEAYRSQTVLT
jgi:hypothetical protein